MTSGSATVRRMTPRGKAALSVFKLEGDLPDLLLTDSGRARRWPAPGSVSVAWVGVRGRLLDQVVVLRTPDGAELHLHGSESLEAELLMLLAEFGVEHEPAVAAPAPRSLPEARACASALHGELSVLALLAREACARGHTTPGLAARLAPAISAIPLGRRLAKPAVVRLVGPPNVGKSTLFNALLGRQRALTSPREGTTRDRVSALVAWRGIPVELQDTEGVDGDPTDQADRGSADLLVDVLAAPAAPQRDGDEVLQVLGRADLFPGKAGVSGRTGQGIEALVRAASDRLQLTSDAVAHAVAPLDASLAELLMRAVELPCRDVIHTDPRDHRGGT